MDSGDSTAAAVVALEAVAGEYCVHRLPADTDADALLAGALAGALAAGRGIVSVTRTPEETSIVCPADVDLPEASSEPGWAAYRVRGTLDFALTGILHALTGPLAAAGIPVFALSTFDTDYLLVRVAARSASEAAWRAAGIAVHGAAG